MNHLFHPVRAALLYSAACLLFHTTAANAGTVLTLTPAAPTVLVGGTFTEYIDIQSTTAYSIDAFQFDLTYDPTVLSVVSVDPTLAFDQVGLPNDGGYYDTSVAGAVSYVSSATTGGCASTADVVHWASVTFRAVGIGNSAVSFANTGSPANFVWEGCVATSSPDPVFTTITNGSVNSIVFSPPPVTQTPEPGTFLLGGLAVTLFCYLRSRD